MAVGHGPWDLIPDGSPGRLAKALMEVAKLGNTSVLSVDVWCARGLRYNGSAQLLGTTTRCAANAVCRGS